MKSMSLFLKEHRPTFFAVFAVWFVFSVVVLLLIYLDFPVMTLPNFGMLGDSFNIITSLFTGLAFAGVVLSVVLQTKELRLQREELEATRKEFKGQTEQLAKQAIHLEKQQQEMVSQSFDNKFFQMLNMFNTNTANLEIPANTKGKKVIKALMWQLISGINNGENSIAVLGNPDHTVKFNKIFKKFNEEHSNILNPYFISLYQILKYINDKAPREEAKRYANIIRAQLSLNELMLLVYHAIGVIQFSGEKYKELLEKYAFFEHLNAGYLYNGNHETYCTDDVLKKYDIKVAGDNEPLKEKMKELQKPKQK